MTSEDVSCAKISSATSEMYGMEIRHIGASWRTNRTFQSSIKNDNGSHNKH